MESEIRNVLITIPELANKVFMLTAPEQTTSPYAVYTMNNNEQDYVLNGVTGNEYQIYDINVYSKDMATLKDIANQIKTKTLGLLGNTQGPFLIQNVKVSNRDFYDSSVDMSRTVIELEIYYKEV